MSKPIRIQRKRTKGWRMPPNTVYVGRGSKWGSKAIVVWHESMGQWAVCTPEDTDWFNTKLEALAFSLAFYKEKQIPLLKQHLSELKGKNLACWCPLDERCHVDVLLELANREQ
jgi:hypothetical protein